MQAGVKRATYPALLVEGLELRGGNPTSGERVGPKGPNGCTGSNAVIRGGSASPSHQALCWQGSVGCSVTSPCMLTAGNRKFTVRALHGAHFSPAVTKQLHCLDFTGPIFYSGTPLRDWPATVLGCIDYNNRSKLGPIVQNARGEYKMHEHITWVVVELYISMRCRLLMVYNITQYSMI